MAAHIGEPELVALELEYSGSSLARDVVRWKVAVHVEGPHFVQYIEGDICGDEPGQDVYLACGDLYGDGVGQLAPDGR